MNIVRLKVEDKNKNIKILAVVAILLIVLLLVLIFNPISNVKTKVDAKIDENMRTPPAYEELQNTKIFGEIKYSLPVSVGSVIVNSDNTMNVKAEPETRVKAIDDGIIVDIGTNSTYGNYIEISHAEIHKDDIYSFYGFLNKPINGDVIVIQKGQKIGEVGSSGYIHFEIRDANHNVTSPYRYMNLTSY